MYVSVCEDPCMEAIGQALAFSCGGRFPGTTASDLEQFAHTTDPSPRLHVIPFRCVKATMPVEIGMG